MLQSGLMMSPRDLLAWFGHFPTASECGSVFQKSLAWTIHIVQPDLSFHYSRSPDKPALAPSITLHLELLTMRGLRGSNSYYKRSETWQPSSTFVFPTWR